jgi:hypothetical protein
MSNPSSIIFVSDIHPEINHVSAQRVWNFARQLALAGKKVTILTQAKTDQSPPTQLHRFAEIVASHDWHLPLIITAHVPQKTFLSNAREGGLIWGVRQAALAAAQFRPGGHFQDWFNAASSLFQAVSEHIRPDAVIGTFGNVGSWAIAQALSAQCNCPWVGDLKDNWRVFSLPGFRHYNAYRFRNMAHMTTYSQTHAEIAAPFFSMKTSVLYSGYHEIENSSSLTDVPPGFMFSGSLYGEDKLRIILDGIAVWAERQEYSKARRAVTLVYAGNEGAQLNALAENFGDLFCVMDLGYLSPINLTRAHRQAICNFYIVNQNSLFQQKFFDLVAADRPIISVPNESDEAIVIADAVGATYFGCDDPFDVAHSIEMALSTQVDGINQEAIKAYSWAQQAAHLSNILDRVTGASK